LSIVFRSKSYEGKKWSAKSLKKIIGVQNHTIDKKIGVKVQLNTKMGCQIAQKKAGAKSHN